MNENEKWGVATREQWTSPDDPLEVELSDEICPQHGFWMISMPRNKGQDKTYTGFKFKCPWKNCSYGK